MPTNEEIATEVKSIFCRTLKLEPEKIQLDSRFQEDLELDSLDMIEVVYEVEDHFNVQIPEDSLKDVRTVQHVVDGLAAAIKANA